MGKAKNSKSKEQYVALYYGFLKSEAWRSLSGAAAKLFLELHTRFHGGNNGKLHLSMNEAAKNLGLGKATIQRAYEELQTKGFIVLMIPGDWYGRRAHDWRLTTKPMETPRGRVVPSNEWHQWRAPKTEVGSNSDPSASRMVPLQNQTARRGSATAPVGAVSEVRLGSGMEH